LPSQVVNDLLETREGEYWVATGAGVCRFNPNGVARPCATNEEQGPTAADAMFRVYFPGEDAKSKEITTGLSVVQPAGSNRHPPDGPMSFRVPSKSLNNGSLIPALMQGELGWRLRG